MLNYNLDAYSGDVGCIENTNNNLVSFTGYSTGQAITMSDIHDIMKKYNLKKFYYGYHLSIYTDSNCEFDKYKRVYFLMHIDGADCLATPAYYAGQWYLMEDYNSVFEEDLSSYIHGSPKLYMFDEGTTSNVFSDGNELLGSLLLKSDDVETEQKVSDFEHAYYLQVLNSLGEFGEFVKAESKKEKLKEKRV